MEKRLIMKLLILSGFLFLSALSLKAQPSGFDQNHSKWGKVLSEYVVETDKTTKVKYFELMKSPTELNSYLKDVSAVTAAEYAKWNEKQKLTFLFNSYNAFTLKLITQELEKDKNLKSIKKIGGLFGNPWKIKFFTFLGKESFLDEIEQDIARKDFDEPRMHFAFNCASIGCPSLLKTAFTEANMEQLLDTAARNFLSDQSRNVLQKNTLALSSILKWYKDDFENSKKFGPMSQFLATYFPFSESEKKAFLAGKYKVKYLDYNWNLNIWTK